MRLLVVGTGYVGLVSGACFAEIGHEVTCLDSDAKKIANLKNGIMPIYEQDLEELVARNVTNNRLHFVSSYPENFYMYDAVFIAVGTPPKDTSGAVELKYIEQVVKELAEKLVNNIPLVIKSTVPVGTGSKMEALFRSIRPDSEANFVSNPEFLREGLAIRDFMNPDRVIIGANDEVSRESVAEIYRYFAKNNVPIELVSRETAELTKYASNSFLAMKIAFINQISDLCEKTGADVEDVARGMGLDPRIGSQFLKVGPGFGGSCFPKDTLGLAAIGKEYGARQTLVEEVISANKARQEELAARIIAEAKNLGVSEIGFLGLTFKAGTDDLRDSPAINILNLLTNAGLKVTAYDPKGMQNAKQLDLSCEFANSIPEAIKQLVVIATEWPEFAEFDYANTELVLDFRNLLDEDSRGGVKRLGKKA